MFRMRNKFEGSIRINIVNFTKNQSLFSQVSYFVMHQENNVYIFRACNHHSGPEVDSKIYNLVGTRLVTT